MSTQRRLLPRPSDDPPKAPPTTVQQSKRTTVIAACEACRAQKTRCDAARPKCYACKKNNRECVYKTKPLESRAGAIKRRHDELELSLKKLQQSHASLQQLLRALQEADDEDASKIFQQIRQGADLDSLVRCLRDSRLLMQVHLAPETRLRYEFPVHPQMPAPLLVQSNPYVRSLLYAATRTPYMDNGPGSDLMRFDSPYITPYATAIIVDPRLDAVKPSQWTNVSNDDDFLRSLLKLYFLYEHLFLNCFHKDLFLDDMLSGETEFCSSLLVNAVLALACNCCNTVRNRFDFWNPHGLGYKFFAEAKRIWEAELYRESKITTVQATLVMGVSYNLYAMDKVAMAYTAEAVRLSQDLKLFDFPGSIEKDMNERHVQGYEFTAWSLFFWVSVKCFLLSIPPFVKSPPATPLPDPDQFPGWYGESHFAYPQDASTYSAHHPHFFKEKCNLGRIINQLGQELFYKKYNSDGGYEYTVRQLSQETLQNHLIDLGSWQFFLPPSLTTTDIVFPFELNLHLLYLAITIKVCKGLVAFGENADNPADPLQSAIATLTHSRICFESIMRIYYLRHGFEMADGHLCHAIFELACDALAQRRIASTNQSCFYHPQILTPEEAQGTLILAVKGLADQGKNYYLPKALCQIFEEEMSAEDVSVLREYVPAVPDTDSEGLYSRSDYVSSQYPLGTSEEEDGSPHVFRLDRAVKEFIELAKIRMRESAPGYATGEN